MRTSMLFVCGATAIALGWAQSRALAGPKGSLSLAKIDRATATALRALDALKTTRFDRPAIDQVVARLSRQQPELARVLETTFYSALRFADDREAVTVAALQQQLEGRTAYYLKRWAGFESHTIASRLSEATGFRPESPEITAIVKRLRLPSAPTYLSRFAVSGAEHGADERALIDLARRRSHPTATQLAKILGGL